MMDSEPNSDALVIGHPGQELLQEFRARYEQFVTQVHEIMQSPTDSTVIARLGDDLDQFMQMAAQVHIYIFVDNFVLNHNYQHAVIFHPDEFDTLNTSLALMQQDLRIRYQEALDQSNYGTIPIMAEIRTGGQGRPKISIDPEWLQWAYGHRSVEGIAAYLGVGRSTVCSALLDYGIAAQQANPFGTAAGSTEAQNSGEPVSCLQMCTFYDNRAICANISYRKLEGMMNC